MESIGWLIQSVLSYLQRVLFYNFFEGILLPQLSSFLKSWLLRQMNQIGLLLIQQHMQGFLYKIYSFKQKFDIELLLKLFTTFIECFH